MTAPSSIQELIEQWPTIGAFAIDIGCGYEAARKMRLRNSIAPEHWARVIEVCEQKTVPGVSYSWLADLRKAAASHSSPIASETVAAVSPSSLGEVPHG